MRLIVSLALLLGVLVALPISKTQAQTLQDLVNGASISAGGLDFSGWSVVDNGLTPFNLSDVSVTTDTNDLTNIGLIYTVNNGALAASGAGDLYDFDINFSVATNGGQSLINGQSLEILAHTVSPTPVLETITLDVVPDMGPAEPQVYVLSDSGSQLTDSIAFAPVASQDITLRGLVDDTGGEPISLEQFSLFFSLSQPVPPPARFSDSANGDWDTATSWQPNGEPDNTLPAYIGGGNVITVNTNNNEAASIFVGHNEITNPGNGTLTIANNGVLSTPSLTIGGGGFDGTVNVLTGGVLNVTGNTTVIDSSGTAVLNVNGGLYTEAGDLVIGTANTGEVNVFNSGTLQVGGNIILGQSGGTGSLNIGNGTAGLVELTGNLTGNGLVTFNNGTLDLASGSTVSAPTTLAGSAFVNVDSGLATITSNIGGGVNTFTKTGAGTLRFNGDKSYTGLTTVDGGTLQIQGGGGDGVIRGNVTVNNGASLQLLTSNRIINTSLITLNGNGTFNMNGNGEAIGALAGSGSVLSGGTLELDMVTSTSPVFTGDLTVGTLNVRGNNVNGSGATQTFGGNGNHTITNLDVRRGNSANDAVVLNLSGTGTTDISGTVRLGLAGSGSATLQIEQSRVVNAGSFSVGDGSNQPGTVSQTGGTVNITNLLRIGHYPGTGSSYNISGGQLNLTGVPNATINPGGVGERAGVIYVGVDGTGTFSVAGTADVNAQAIVLDARGNTAGVDTFNLTGGMVTLTSTTGFGNGIRTGSNDGNASYQINLGGGTLAAGADWASPLDMTLTGTNGNVTFDTMGNNIDLTGTLTGPGGLTKLSNGSLTLTNANSYTGGTILGNSSNQSNNRTRIGDDDALGTGAITFLGARLSSIGGAARIIDNDVTFGAGGGSSAYLGHGTDNGLLTFTGAMNLAGSNRTIQVDSSVVFAGAVTNGGGGGYIRKTGNGMLTFLNDGNTYSGGTIIDGGVVRVGNGTGTGSLGPGTIDVNSQLWLDRGAPGYTINSDVNLNGGILRAVSGVNQVNGSSSDINISGASTFTADAGAELHINVNGSGDNIGFTGNPTLTLGGAGIGSIDRDIARGGANGTVIKTGTGTWTLSGSMAADEGWSGGDLLIQQGTIQLGNNEVISHGVNKGDVNIASGAVLDLNGFSETVNGLEGSGTVDNVNGGGTSTLNVGANDTDSQFDGVIKNTTGTVELNKVGNGTFTLTADQEYTGNTQVLDGTLHLQNVDISDSPLTTVFSGATLSGIGTTGDLTILDGGTHDPGNSPGVMNVVGAYNLAGTLDIDINSPFTGNSPVAGADHSQINVMGSVTLDSVTSQLTVTDFVPGSSFNPDFGTIFTIINNDGSDLVNGTFAGLTAGSTVDTIDGVDLHIYYNADAGGDNNLNDVVLVAAGNAPALYVNDQWTMTEAVDGNQETMTVENAFVGLDAFSSTADAFGQVPGFSGPLTLNGNSIGAEYDVDLTTNAGDVDVLLVGDLQSPGVAEPNVFINNLTGGSGDSITINAEGNGNGNLTVYSGNFGGVIQGNGTLTKDDPGSLTLSGANTYSGVTTIEAGTLIVGNSSALGSSAAGTTVEANGTLELNGFNIQPEVITLNGGTVTNTGGSQTNALRFVELTADSTFTGTSRFDVRGSTGYLDLAGFTLTKNGTNKVALVDLAQITDGTIDIDSGTLGLTRTNWANGLVNVGTGTTLQFENNSGSNHSYSMDINIENNGLILGTGNGGTTTLDSDIFMEGLAEFQITGTHTLLSRGVISGTGPLVKTDNGTLVLDAVNTYTGLTQVEDGVLEVRNSGALGTTAMGTVVNDAAGSDVGTLSLAGLTGDLTVVDEDLTLNGNGFGGNGALWNRVGNNTWDGDVTLASSSRIRVDVNPGAPGSMMVAPEYSLTLTQALQGPGNLEKTGGGTLILDGPAKTYTGDTTITEGWLQLTSTSDFAFSKTVNVMPAGTLDLRAHDIYTFEDITSGPSAGGRVLNTSGVVLATDLHTIENTQVNVTGGAVLVKGGNAQLGDLVVRDNADWNQTGGTVQIQNNLLLGITDPGDLGTSYTLDGGVLDLTSNTPNSTPGPLLVPNPHTSPVQTMPSIDYTYDPSTTPAQIAGTGQFVFSGGILRDVDFIELPNNMVNVASRDSRLENDPNHTGGLLHTGGTFELGNDAIGETVGHQTTINGAYDQQQNAILAADIYLNTISGPSPHNALVENDDDGVPSGAGGADDQARDQLVAYGDVYLDGTLVINWEPGTSTFDNVTPWNDRWNILHVIDDEPSTLNLILGPNFNVENALYRVQPDGMGGYYLQVLIPEPASMLTWGMLLGLGGWYWRRRRNKARKAA